MSQSTSHQHADPACNSGRRRFLGGLTAGMLVTPVLRLSAGTAAPAASDFRSEAESLLRDWCDGLLRQQVNDPTHPDRHGSFRCPACNRIHGRCGDAVLPLLAMAAKSGKVQYRDAALAVWGWMKNVDSPDGAWTNEPDPKSWKGITVFGATALAEALEWHGDLLDEATRAVMRQRLKLAGGYILDNFTTEYGNINYAAAGAHGLCLLGRLLDEPAFSRRGRELASQVLEFFTPQNRLLFGEGRPSDRRSAKGCYPVDLGYNVTESLPSLIHYALLEDDKPVLAAALASFKAHLEFMMPDGGWDNSWGTRSYKWTYWGSRTADGCQSAFIRLAATDPAFGTAAMRNLELLRACTKDGLLLGGPHYADHQVPACVHHTFVQSKAIAGALHYLKSPQLVEPGPDTTKGSFVRHFPESDVVIVRSNSWRASFSGYDWFYRPALKQATGGTPGLLWHERLGPVLAAGLAEYQAVEEANMQPLPAGCGEPVSCRVEYRSATGECFSNLFNDSAIIRHEVIGTKARVTVETRLVSRTGASPQSGAFKVFIDYAFGPDSFTITVRPGFPESVEWTLVVPVISRKSEVVTTLGDMQLEIRKPVGTLRVSCSNAMQPIKTPTERAFSLSPGFEVLPLRITTRGAHPVSCKLSYEA